MKRALLPDPAADDCGGALSHLVAPTWSPPSCSAFSSSSGRTYASSSGSTFSSDVNIAIKVVDQ